MTATLIPELGPADARYEMVELAPIDSRQPRLFDQLVSLLERAAVRSPTVLVIDDVCARSAGNPFFAEELLAAADALDAGLVLLRAEAERAGNRATIRLGRRTSAPFGLTPRELDVLALLARGMTNPQIGEALYISRKTASAHVSNILEKLGVHTRGEAGWATTARDCSRCCGLRRLTHDDTSAATAGGVHHAVV